MKYKLDFIFSDVFGDTTILGDNRWAGAYGIDADFIAGEQCCVARVRARDVEVEFAFFLFRSLSLNSLWNELVFEIAQSLFDECKYDM